MVVALTALGKGGDRRICHSHTDDVNVGDVARGAFVLVFGEGGSVLDRSVGGESHGLHLLLRWVLTRVA